jgi:hypothetical protein
VRRIDTPHLLHGWDAGLVYEEVTGNPAVRDLFTTPGAVPPFATTTSSRGREHLRGQTALTPSMAPTIRRLAALAPTLAIMHG